MKRTIIKIDEDKCTGCGLCVSGCHEGALQIIDNKARLVSELFCDGLGACIGECPEGAITLEEREAEPYSEVQVMERIVKSGKSTILAHLRHLRDHNEKEYVKQAVLFLKEKNLFPELIDEFKMETHTQQHHHHHGGSCPGSKMVDFRAEKPVNNNSKVTVNSQLKQWPVQLHLLNPTAPYFRNADVLIAADCVAYAYGNFHNDLLKGKSLIIACPKLDSNLESYIEKIKIMIDEAKVNTITVVMMEVPCCGGMLQITKSALQQASRKVPLKAIYISIKGDVLKEEWI
ncbi:MAG: 4Fe-4S binding protein [Bacteroidales bacterium]|jgi:ferredoxin|nr:4Fe-4S binding protein [Bacteroidales bacterium]MDD4213588.1 4Fe-4S binding protein [Bacteroidales bacterium]